MLRSHINRINIRPIFNYTLPVIHPCPNSAQFQHHPVTQFPATPHHFANPSHQSPWCVLHRTLIGIVPFPPRASFRPSGSKAPCLVISFLPSATRSRLYADHYLLNCRGVVMLRIYPVSGQLSRNHNPCSPPSPSSSLFGIRFPIMNLQTLLPFAFGACGSISARRPKASTHQTANVFGSYWITRSVYGHDLLDCGDV